MSKRYPLILCRLFLCSKASCQLSRAVFPGWKRYQQFHRTVKWATVQECFLAATKWSLLGNLWDSKHHNWSGHSATETWIQMSRADMPNLLLKVFEFSLIQHLEIEFFVVTAPFKLLHPMLILHSVGIKPLYQWNYGVNTALGAWPPLAIHHFDQCLPTHVIPLRSYRWTVTQFREANDRQKLGS